MHSRLHLATLCVSLETRSVYPDTSIPFPPHEGLQRRHDVQSADALDTSEVEQLPVAAVATDEVDVEGHLVDILGAPAVLVALAHQEEEPMGLIGQAVNGQPTSGRVVQLDDAGRGFAVDVETRTVDVRWLVAEYIAVTWGNFSYYVVIN